MTSSFIHSHRPTRARRNGLLLALVASLLALVVSAVPSTARAAEREEPQKTEVVHPADQLCIDFPWYLGGRRCFTIPDIPPTVDTPSRISGTAREGQTLTGADADFRAFGWDVPWPLSTFIGSRIGLDDRVVDRYFTRDGDRRANGSSMVVSTDDVGKHIRYRTVGEAYKEFTVLGIRVRVTFGKTPSDSAAVVPEGLPLSNTSKPTISGSAREGGALTCTPGGWSPSPSSRQLEFLRNGNVVEGDGTYTPTAADVGKQLTCRESVSRLGQSNSASSDPVTVVAAALVNRSRPQVYGTPKVGRRLSCLRGTWTPNPTSRRYQFLRNGVVVANARTYVARRSDAGRRLSCRESVSRLGQSAAAVSRGVIVRR